MCTCFGETANRYSSLIPDNIYAISGATVNENTYNGVTTLRLAFSDQTKVSQVESDDIPFIDHFCLTLNEARNLEKGSVCSLISLVKEGETVSFISRNKNQITKKTLFIYDIENSIEAEVVLFNDKTSYNFP